MKPLAEAIMKPLADWLARASVDSGSADRSSGPDRSIDPAGFLWLANGQSWERRTSMRNWFTVGQRVWVLARSGPLPGVLAAVTGHIATLALPEPNELTWNDFWVDTGLTRDELLARGVTPGTRVIWDAATIQLGPHVVGKALDEEETSRLADIEAELDRCWDLLNQRRALREFGMDPGEATPRDEDVVEGYQQ